MSAASHICSPFALCIKFPGQREKKKKVGKKRRVDSKSCAEEAICGTQQHIYRPHTPRNNAPYSWVPSTGIFISLLYIKANSNVKRALKQLKNARIWPAWITQAQSPGIDALQHTLQDHRGPFLLQEQAPSSTADGWSSLNEQLFNIFLYPHHSICSPVYGMLLKSWSK